MLAGECLTSVDSEMATADTNWIRTIRKICITVEVNGKKTDKTIAKAER